MCNLYSITTNQAAIIALFRVVNRYLGNLAPMPGVFPDYQAPIVRNGAEGRELATARWGMPSSSKALMDATKKRAEKLQAKGKTVDFTELLRMEPDGGTTNIRNMTSKHWTRWLGAEHRCVVPFNSFSEFNKAEGGDIWFALDEGRPPRLLRRQLDQLDVRPEGQGRRDHQRHLRVPDDRTERRGWRHPPESDASDPDDAGRG
jgi:putative SOS response-associated peptidase YedK